MTVLLLSKIDFTQSGITPEAGTITQSWYDYLPNTTLPANFQCAWPTITAAKNPFIDVNHPLVPFGSYFGLASQIQSEHAAERFYYDGKGRILCHVYLHESLVEPKITWTEYDPNDLPTRVYSVYSGQAYGMTYDDWNRVEAIYDLTPVPATMDLQILYQASDTAGNTSEIGVTQAWLGSLVREDLSLSNTQAIALANYSYGPSGQVIEVVYGDPLKANMKGTYLSDIRGMSLNYELKAGSENLFKQEFDYFGNGGLLSGGEETLKRYDGMLTRIRETYRPDASPTNPEEDLLTKTYQYDMGGQLIDAQTTMGFYSGGGTPKTFSNHYGYDRSGNRLYEDRLNVPKSQGADQTGSMEHVIASNSNRLTQVDLSTFNGTLVEMDGKEFPSFTYDANGNILAFEQKFSGTNRDRSFEYGDWRFQTQATHWEQDTEDGTDVHTFTYDHSGARISRSVVKNAGSEEWTYFLPAGNDNMAEFDGFGRLTRNYLFVGGNRIGFKSKRYSGLYVKDHLGSTRMVVDLYSQSSGPSGVSLLTAFSDTDAYGNILRDINVGDFNGQPHGYTGQEREPDYDGMHFGARLYLPDLGRFLQIDPADEFWNSYSYVGNNPIYFVDENGMNGDPVGVAVATVQIGYSLYLLSEELKQVGAEIGQNLVDINFPASSSHFDDNLSGNVFLAPSFATSTYRPSLTQMLMDIDLLPRSGGMYGIGILSTARNLDYSYEVATPEMIGIYLQGSWLTAMGFKGGLELNIFFGGTALDEGHWRFPEVSLFEYDSFSAMSKDTPITAVGMDMPNISMGVNLAFLSPERESEIFRSGETLDHSYRGLFDSGGIGPGGISNGGGWNVLGYSTGSKNYVPSGFQFPGVSASRTFYRTVFTTAEVGPNATGFYWGEKYKH